MHKHPGGALAYAFGYLLRAEAGGEGEVTASEGLAQAEDIRRDTGVLTGKQAPAAAKASGDFIGDQQQVISLAEVLAPAK